MYSFNDTTNRGVSGGNLPSEALKLNGSYIENLIPGYRTLTVKGRESLSPKLKTVETNVRDGSRLQYRRYPERNITVRYQLMAESNEAFREAYNKLGEVLDVKEATLIFNDEQDKYFVGTPSGIDSVDPGCNNVIGTFTILCTDPFKYDVEETVVESSEITVEGETFTALSTNYTGTYEAYPKFHIEFADDTSSAGAIGSSADCGYVLMAKNGTNYSIQFGDDEEKDTSLNIAINTDFAAATKGTDWKDNTSLPLPVVENYFASRPTGVVEFSSSRGGARVSSYGTTQSGKFFGPMIAHALTNVISGEMEVSWKQLFSVAESAAVGQPQMGIMMVLLYDSNNVLRYGYGLKKANKTGLKGEVIAYDSENGYKVLKTQVDLSWTNPTGYVAKGGWQARYSTNTLKREQTEDSKWRVSVNAAHGNFTLGVYEECPDIKTVGFFLGRYSSNPIMALNAVRMAKIVGGEVDVANTFSANDVLDIDCASMGVQLNNMSAEGIGDISNDWSNMTIDRGQNIFLCQWSDWVPAGKEPTFTMSYRRRYI